MRTLFKFSAAVSPLILSLLLPASAAEPATTPAVGAKAPLIQGKDQDGKTWKLADAIGKKVVLLYFYPKDDTPGCTKEACGLRDRLGDLKADNVEVIGVSFDSGDSHQKFIAKFNLNFPLLADTDGKILDVTDTPSADIHLSEMKDAVAKLKKSRPAKLC